MRVPFADLRAQYNELKDQIDRAIVDVIESGVFSGGPYVSGVEAEIASSCGAAHGIAVASGTDALILSLVACGVRPGDEVITTSFTFGATAEAIVLVGATPVFVDIDNCTFNLDIDQVEAHITGRTRAVLPVDLYGQMADRRALAELTRRHGLRLILDSAQAVGARQYGVPIAAHGDTTTLSFYPSKNLGAYGDGGMILTSDDQIVASLKSLRAHGTARHKYLYEKIGYCSRLDAMQAAVLHAKLPRLSEWNEARRRNAALYDELLAPAPCLHREVALPGTDAGNYHIYHQYTIRHPRRDSLRDHLDRSGVASAIYYPWPLHLCPAYREYGSGEGSLPVAECAAREVLSLPVHPELEPDQIAYVAQLVREFAG